MAKGVKFWTPERDQKLRAWWDEGLSVAQVVARFEDGVSPDSVNGRLRRFGLKPRQSAFWNPDRDLRLRELWAMEPAMTLQQIADAMDAPVSRSSVSSRAASLKLPSRYATASHRTAEPGSKNVAYRSPFPGENPARGAETPRLRVVPFERFQPCPFYHPMEDGACDVMVDRKPRADGTLPPQYCARHRDRVIPIPKGPLGFIRRHAHGVAGLGRTA